MILWENCNCPCSELPYPYSGALNTANCKFLTKSHVIVSKIENNTWKVTVFQSNFLTKSHVISIQNGLEKPLFFQFFWPGPVKNWKIGNFWTQNWVPIGNPPIRLKKGGFQLEEPNPIEKLPFWIPKLRVVRGAKRYAVEPKFWDRPNRLTGLRNSIKKMNVSRLNPFELHLGWPSRENGPVWIQKVTHTSDFNSKWLNLLAHTTGNLNSDGDWWKNSLCNTHSQESFWSLVCSFTYGGSKITVSSSVF